MSLTVRVSGRAEFSHIKREVKDLDHNLRGLRNTVEKGFTRGFFTSEQSRNAQFLIGELKRGERDLNSILDEQRTIIDDIQRKWESASEERRKALQQELAQRQEILKTHEAELDSIRKKREQLERQMNQLDTTDPVGSGGTGFSPLVSFGKQILGILGVGSAVSYSRQALVLNAERQRAISDLGMRLGATGREDFEDYRRGIRDTGMEYGFNALESYQMVDTYTSRAGAITAEDQDAMQGFTRAFGLSANQVAQTFGEIKRFGGSDIGQQRQLADMMAYAIDKGGMQERAVEAMETTAGLMGDLARRLPEVSSAGVMAMQTLLNQTESEAFKGERGGDFLGALDNMVASGANDAGEAFILRALGWGTDKNYYEARLQAEKGIYDQEGENLPAVLGFLQKTVKDVEFQDLILSNLAGVTLSMAREFRIKTDNYSKLEELPTLIKELQKESGGTVDGKVDVWETSMGAVITKIDTELAEALAKLGNSLNEDFIKLKGTTAGIVDDLTKILGADEYGGGGGVFGDLVTKTTALTVAVTGLTTVVAISNTLLRTRNLFGGKSEFPGTGGTSFGSNLASGGMLGLGVGTLQYVRNKSKGVDEDKALAGAVVSGGVTTGAYMINPLLGIGTSLLSGVINDQTVENWDSAEHFRDTYNLFPWKTPHEDNAYLAQNLSKERWVYWKELEKAGMGTVQEYADLWAPLALDYRDFVKAEKKSGKKAKDIISLDEYLEQQVVKQQAQEEKTPTIPGVETKQLKPANSDIKQSPTYELAPTKSETTPTYLPKNPPPEEVAEPKYFFENPPIPQVSPEVKPQYFFENPPDTKPKQEPIPHVPEVKPQYFFENPPEIKPQQEPIPQVSPEINVVVPSNKPDVQFIPEAKTAPDPLPKKDIPDIFKQDSVIKQLLPEQEKAPESQDYKIPWAEQPTAVIPEQAQKPITTASAGSRSPRQAMDLNINLRIDTDHPEVFTQDNILEAFKEVAREAFAQWQHENTILYPTVRGGLA